MLPFWADGRALDMLRHYRLVAEVGALRLENFWSLLKRGLKGTYISVEPFHLFRYLDEQVFRYNHRKDADDNPLKDGDRFHAAVGRILGKRLTYRQVTGKTADGQTWVN